MYRRNDEGRTNGLASLLARLKVEVLKAHVEIHRSFRDCNEVTRKVLTGGGQVLNALGREYMGRVDSKSIETVRGPYARGQLDNF